jgi:hypothetical protein
MRGRLGLVDSGETMARQGKYKNNYMEKKVLHACAANIALKTSSLSSHHSL